MTNETFRIQLRYKLEAIYRELRERIAEVMQDTTSRYTQDANKDTVSLPGQSTNSFTEIANDITYIIGICAPAADPIRARESSKMNDKRY